MGEGCLVGREERWCEVALIKYRNDRIHAQVQSTLCLVYSFGAPIP